jgi:hypothetical protein
MWSARLILAFVGVPSLGFAVVSGLFNASFAARLGHSEHEQLTWIMASVLITVFVTGLPLAIEVLRGRVPHLAKAARGLWLGALVFSFVAAMGYAAITHGQATAEADATLKGRSRIERAIARGEAELEALPRHRPADAVRADLRRAEATVGFDCLDIRSRRERHACAPVFELRAELAAAREAARIETRLARQRQKLDNLAVVGTSANPQASILAWMVGGVLSADVWERLITIFVAALIEMSAAMGLAITARSVVEILAEPQAPAPAPEPPETVTPLVLEPSPVTAIEPELGWQTWFQACVTAQRGARITPQEAFEHYERWASLNNVTGVLPKTTFGKRMSKAVQAIGGEIGRSNQRYYANVTLVQMGESGIPLLEGKSDGEAAE